MTNLRLFRKNSVINDVEYLVKLLPHFVDHDSNKVSKKKGTLNGQGRKKRNTKNNLLEETIERFLNDNDFF